MAIASTHPTPHSKNKELQKCLDKLGDVKSVLNLLRDRAMTKKLNYQDKPLSEESISADAMIYIIHHIEGVLSR